MRDAPSLSIVSRLVGGGATVGETQPLETDFKPARSAPAVHPCGAIVATGLT
jgi:hypothetical protein